MSIQTQRVTQTQTTFFPYYSTVQKWCQLQIYIYIFPSTDLVMLYKEFFFLIIIISSDMPLLFSLSEITQERLGFLLCIRAGDIRPS